MESKIVQYLAVLHFFVCTEAYSRQSSNTGNLLQRLLGPKSAKPIVVFLDVNEHKARSTDFDELHNEGGDGDYRDDDDDGLRAREQGAHDVLHANDDGYFLYHLLKDVIEADFSSSSSEELKPTKQLLRTALRARCGRVDSCVQKCPPRKPSCPMNCQAVFDNLNMCPPPTTTENPCDNRPKCGRTMPPSWRF